MSSFTLLAMALVLFSLHSTEAQIGVCYGMKGHNLSSGQEDVVNLYKSNGIQLMRLYDPNPAALQALQGSGIKLLLGVLNGQIQSLAQDQSQAMSWVRDNVVPFASSIRYIAVGNEVDPSTKPFVLPAMENVENALNAVSLGGQIKVSTSIPFDFFSNTVPPSLGTFADSSFMGPIVNFLDQNRSPLLVNVYPYFAYNGDETDIPLNYALFTAPGTVVTDPNNHLNYQNLFDAMLDAAYAALSKAGGPNIPIVVSESGWPSHGGDSSTTIDNAGTYYRNLISHVRKGTPLKPGQSIETYLFAMFNEDQKPGAETEKHFGLFFPDTRQPKYGQLNFAQ